MNLSSDQIDFRKSLFEGKSDEDAAKDLTSEPEIAFHDPLINEWAVDASDEQIGKMNTLIHDFNGDVEEALSSQKGIDLLCETNNDEVLFDQEFHMIDAHQLDKNQLIQGANLHAEKYDEALEKLLLASMQKFEYHSIQSIHFLNNNSHKDKEKLSDHISFVIQNIHDLKNISNEFCEAVKNDEYIIQFIKTQDFQAFLNIISSLRFLINKDFSNFIMELGIKEGFKIVKESGFSSVLSFVSHQLEVLDTMNLKIRGLHSNHR